MSCNIMEELLIFNEWPVRLTRVDELIVDMFREF